MARLKRAATAVAKTGQAATRAVHERDAALHAARDAGVPAWAMVDATGLGTSQLHKILRREEPGDS